MATPNQQAGKSTELAVDELMKKVRPDIMKILPKHISPERFFMIADKAIRRNKDLMKCSASSMATSLLASAELGFEPGGSLPFVHLVPYGNKNTGMKDCQLIIDYRGLIDLAKRGGSVSQIEAHVVYKNEKFDISFGHPKMITHTPITSGDRGPAIGAWAIAYQKDGGEPQFEYMTKEDIVKIKNRAQSKAGPWSTDEMEMWKKTVVRRLCKYLITSDNGPNRLLAKGLALEDRAELGEPAGDIIDVPHVEEAPVIQPKEKPVTEKFPTEKTKSESPTPEDKGGESSGIGAGVQIVELWKNDGVYKSGKNKGNKFSRYFFKDNYGREYNTFDADVAEVAYQFKMSSAMVDIIFEDEGKFGLKVSEIVPFINSTDTPDPGK